MAKRGYRGRHPYDDMKVSGNLTKAANKTKLKKEYKRTKPKLQNDYIKSHDGFASSVKAEASITWTGTITNAKYLDLKDTYGHTIRYTAGNAEDCPTFDRSNGTVSSSLAACINSASIGHSGTIKAVVGTEKITLTQDQPGPDGETSLGGDLDNVTLVNFNI